MIKVVIGSMVLCHLLVPGEMPQNQNAETQPIVKLLGQVTDIQKGSRYIEQVDKKEALRADRDILIIKGQNRPGLYQVDSRACMLVRDESPQEREERLFPKIKQVVEEIEESPKLPSEEVKEEPLNTDANKAGIEIQDRPAIDDPSPTPVMEEVRKELKEVKEEVKPTPQVAPTPSPKVEEVKPVAPKVESKPLPKKEAPVKEEVKQETKESNKSLLDYIK